MAKQRGIQLISGLMIFLSFLTGCFFKSELNVDPLDPQYFPSYTISAGDTATPFQAVSNTPMVKPPTSTTTPTFTPTATDTPLPTDTPAPTPTPAWVSLPAGHVQAPILLYHHISNDGYGNRYYVSVDDFRAQMETLRNLGYTAITITNLAEVLLNGGELPPRPVVITFDDGNLDVYENAFPIMRELGLVGTNYIVANRLEAKNFINPDQLREMGDAGWELGSHSMDHTDLTTDYSIANYEIRQSMLVLEEATGEPVSTFAYPYGKTDEFVSAKVSQ
ncbi:MAG: polysaccharide deacetylase family protein, partial [Anaerolineae bacterium]|nr:polysaccharide deacetylase family protein [Anaerolineae bacterium]